MIRSRPATAAILGRPFVEWTRQLRSCFIEDYQAAGLPKAKLQADLLNSFLKGTIQR